MMLTCAAFLALASVEPSRAALPAGLADERGALATGFGEVICEVDVRTTTVRCGDVQRSDRTTDAVLTSSLYVNYVFSNVQYDAAARLHSLDVKVQNKLGQAIGTPDGSNVTGVRLYIDRIWTIQGTGTVTAANMDDSLLVNGAHQPSWLYNESVAPGAVSSARTVRFNRPSTVQSFGFRVGVYTAFPAEQQVTLMPPATEPSWYEDDSSRATHPVWGPYLKRVAVVRFNEAATLSERQLAVAYVGGTVVGGRACSAEPMVRTTCSLRTTVRARSWAWQ